jgi:hypothetical protein
MSNKRLNEFQLDDEWQRGVFNRLLAPVLMDTYSGHAIFIDYGSPVAKMLQAQAHVDVIGQTAAGGMISTDVKIVRWPGAKEGRPSHYHWRDVFLETWSSTVDKKAGWMKTAKGEFLLWCQCSLKEQWMDCYPFPFDSLRAWTRRHYRELQVRRVENRIDGRALWTEGVLAPIGKLCRDLRVEGFRVDQDGLISDLWGKPLLNTLRGAA